jgi:hypothetical protein
MYFRRVIDRLKTFGRWVQGRVVTAGLVFLYLFGIGVTKLWVSVFHRRLLAPLTPLENTYWLEANGHEFDVNSSDRQS